MRYDQAFGHYVFQNLPHRLPKTSSADSLALTLADEHLNSIPLAI